MSNFEQSTPEDGRHPTLDAEFDDDSEAYIRNFEEPLGCSFASEALADRRQLTLLTFGIVDSDHLLLPLGMPPLASPFPRPSFSDGEIQARDEYFSYFPSAPLQQDLEMESEGGDEAPEEAGSCPAEPDLNSMVADILMECKREKGADFKGCKRKKFRTNHQQF